MANSAEIKQSNTAPRTGVYTCAHSGIRVFVQ
uniref:Uncharacterized protein n=1 Tax=Anguilla anguilla TaxID=7936 RepID=A0A0E9RTV4_ANGAN